MSQPPDFEAIADALAARFAGGVTTPPKPASAPRDVRTATADVGNAMGALPCVYVFTESGSVPVQGHQTRQMVTRHRVRFYLELASDDARMEARLRDWLTVFVQRLKVATQLGGLVDWCRIVEWRLGIVPFGTARYDGFELIVDAATSETWAAA